MSNWKDYIARRNMGAGMDAAEEQPAAISSPLDRPLPVTFFGNKFASSKTQETVTLRGLVERITTTQAKTKDALPWLKLATFGDVRNEPKTPGAQGSLRHDANVLRIDGVEADYDGEQITVARARTILAGAGIAAILYTSPSHTEDTPRWRVLCPTSVSLPPTQRAALVARVNGLFVGALAGESFTLSQSYFYGKLSGNPSHEVAVVEGKAIDLADELDAGAIGRQKPEPVARPVQAQPMTRAPLTDGGTAYGLAALDGECEAIRTAPDGNKHHTVNKAAYAIGGLVTAGELLEGNAFAELSAALDTILPYCKDKRAAQNTLRTAFREGMGRPRDVPEHVAPASELTPDEQAQITARCGPMLAKLAQKHIEVAQKHSAAQAKPLPVTADIMNCGGIMQMIVEECVRTAMRPQPFLALGSAIAAVGTLAGRRYRGPTDLRTNFYIGAVAESGAGKDHSPEFVRRAMFDAGLDKYMGGENLASGRAILSSLEQHPARLFQIDELGMFLRTVTGKNAPSHKMEIWSELMKLYSRAKGVYGGTEYANQKENARVNLQQPHAGLYGMTTPSTFWSALEGGALLDGSLARFLVFVTDDHRPPRNDAAGIVKPSERLLDGLRSVAAGAAGHDYGGNLGTSMMATAAMEPYTVQMSPAATALHRKHQDEDEDAWALKAVGTPQAAIVNRLGENAAKLALVRAISANPASPKIEAEDVAWGWTLSLHCARTLLKDADRYIAESDYERKLNKAMEIIRRHGPISEGDMVNRRRWRLSGPERTEVLRTLVTTGMVDATARPGGPGAGRPTTLYAIGARVSEVNSTVQ